MDIDMQEFDDYTQFSALTDEGFIFVDSYVDGGIVEVVDLGVIRVSSVTASILVRRATERGLEVLR